MECRNRIILKVLQEVVDLDLSEGICAAIEMQTNYDYVVKNSAMFYVAKNRPWYVSRRYLPYYWKLGNIPPRKRYLAKHIKKLKKELGE